VNNTPLGDTDSTDSALILRLREGDSEAYAELYARHHRAALGLARMLTDQTTADDVVSESFLKLYVRITAGGGPETDFRAYLMRTVRTTLIDHQRRGSKIRLVDQVDESALPGTVAGSGVPDISEQIAEQSALAIALRELPERWRQVLAHLYLEDKDRTEVAKILGMSPGSVSALSFRAREGLRRAYLGVDAVETPADDRERKFAALAVPATAMLVPGLRKGGSSLAGQVRNLVAAGSLAGAAASVAILAVTVGTSGGGRDVGATESGAPTAAHSVVAVSPVATPMRITSTRSSAPKPAVTTRPAPVAPPATARRPAAARPTPRGLPTAQTPVKDRRPAQAAQPSAAAPTSVPATPSADAPVADAAAPEPTPVPDKPAPTTAPELAPPTWPLPGIAVLPSSPTPTDPS